MKVTLLLLTLAACHSREVQVVLSDKSTVRVETSATESHDTAEVRVTVVGECTPLLLVVPAPFGYRAAQALAEKPSD